MHEGENKSGKNPEKNRARERIEMDEKRREDQRDLCLVLLLHREHVKTIMANAQPTARMISRCSVVGACKTRVMLFTSKLTRTRRYFAAPVLLVCASSHLTNATLIPNHTVKKAFIFDGRV